MAEINEGQYPCATKEDALDQCIDQRKVWQHSTGRTHEQESHRMRHKQKSSCWIIFFRFSGEHFSRHRELVYFGHSYFAVSLRYIFGKFSYTHYIFQTRFVGFVSSGEHPRGNRRHAESATGACASSCYLT